MPRSPFQTPLTFGPDGHNLAILKIEWMTGPGGGRVPLYVGWADSGTATSTALWRIVKLLYLDVPASDQPTDLLWASGTSDFSQVWDNRATTITYS